MTAAMSSSNIEIAHSLIERFLSSDDEYDFTQHFIQAALNGNTDICQYLISKDVYIDYNKLLSKSKSYFISGPKTFHYFYDLMPPTLKPFFLQASLNNVLKCNDKELINFVVSQDCEFPKGLYCACKFSDLDTVKLFLKKNSTPEYINQVFSKGPALNVAIKNKKFDIVRELVSLPGIDISLSGPNGELPIFLAAAAGDIKFLKIIIDCYSKENSQKHEKQIVEALHYIISIQSDPKYSMGRNNMKFARFSLVRNRLPISKYNASRSSGFSSLEGRIINKRIEHVEPEVVPEPKEVKHVKEEEEEDSEEQNSKPAKQQAKEGDNQSYSLKIFNLLLAIPNLNINRIIENSTVLTKAIGFHQFKFVKSLLNYEGIDVNILLPLYDATPLLLAINQGYLDICQLLINHPKININLSNSYQMTPLILAASNLLSVVPLILNHPNFDPQKSNINKAFFYCHSPSILKLLVEQPNLNVNYFFKIDSDYENAFSMALLSKNSNKLDFILDHPSFVPETNYKKNLIQYLNSFSEPTFAKFLEKYEIPINMKINNQSLLMHAVVNYHPKVAEYIINYKDFDAIKSDLHEAFDACLAAITIDKSGGKDIDKRPVPNLIKSSKPNCKPKQSETEQKEDRHENASKEKNETAKRTILSFNFNFSTTNTKSSSFSKSKQSETGQKEDRQENASKEKNPDKSEIAPKKPDANFQSKPTGCEFNCTFHANGNVQKGAIPKNATGCGQPRVLPSKCRTSEEVSQESRFRSFQQNRERRQIPSPDSYDGEVLLAQSIFIYDQHHNQLINPNGVCSTGDSYIEFAFNNNHADLALLLIQDPRTNIHQTFGKQKKTILHMACRNPVFEPILVYLLENQLIDINAVDDHGNTPLIEAAQAKNGNAIEILFEQNDLDYLKANANHQTALMILSPISSMNNSMSRDEYLVQLRKMIDADQDQIDIE